MSDDSTNELHANLFEQPSLAVIHDRAPLSVLSEATSTELVSSEEEPKNYANDNTTSMTETIQENGQKLTNARGAAMTDKKTATSLAERAATVEKDTRESTLVRNGEKSKVIPHLVKQTVRLLVGDDPRKKATGKRPPKTLTDRQLIKLESQIGQTLFGVITPGHSRDFFCLDGETWVWYEQWLDENGQPKNHTIRYEIRPHGIMKIEDGGSEYYFLKGEELDRLALAVTIYTERVMREIYQRDPATGKLLTSVPAIINAT